MAPGIVLPLGDCNAGHRCVTGPFCPAMGQVAEGIESPPGMNADGAESERRALGHADITVLVLS